MVRDGANLVCLFSLDRREHLVFWVHTSCFGYITIDAPVFLKTIGWAFESNKKKSVGLTDPLLYCHRVRMKVVQL